MHMDEWILISRITEEEQEEIDAYLLEQEAAYAAQTEWEDEDDYDI